jgi:IS5 family transposase
MLGERQGMGEDLFVACSLRDLIPEDYILRKVDRVLDLSWLRGEVADLYCGANGRPSIDPEAAVRLMLAGFFLGIVHDRKLMREAGMHLGIRWFAGFALHDALPDHSSLTRLRQRWGADRFKRIFERTIAQCVKAGLVGGETVHVDATLIRADVSWESLVSDHTDRVIEENAEVRESSGANADDDPPAPRRQGRPRTREPKPKKRSTTDPDCTLTTSSKEFRMIPSFKQHTAVDDKAGVVLDAEVTTGEQSEGQQLLDQVERVRERLGHPPQCVTADGGYGHGRNWAGLEARKIDAIIPPQKIGNNKPVPASWFKYDARHQSVMCPRGQKLKPSHRVGGKLFFRSSRRKCAQCPLRADCVMAATGVRVITIGEGYEALIRARRRHARQEPRDRILYDRHRWIVEGRHAEAKIQHGLNRAVRRGLDNVRIQAYLTAAVMNLKRLAKVLGPPRGPKRGPWHAWEGIWSGILAIFHAVGISLGIRSDSNLVSRRNLQFGGA